MDKSDKKIFKIATLYKFVNIKNPQNFKKKIYSFCEIFKIKGTLLISHEGINGTISGENDNVILFIKEIKKIKCFSDIDVKYSFHSKSPFLRIKVKLKKEIVTMGVNNINPNSQSGKYLNPDQWNNFIKDPNVIVVDTRNDYEIKIGKFENSINPMTKNFREFPSWVSYFSNKFKKKKNIKIAMYCTGGIRCEKSTSLMKTYGFENVYHLKGGILNYLKSIPKNKSLWQGECFVFDDRVSLNHQLKKGAYDLCHACRTPIKKEEMKNKFWVEGVSCLNCHDKTTKKQRIRFSERNKQINLAKERGEQHLGKKLKF